MLNGNNRDTRIDKDTARDIHERAAGHGILWAVYRYPSDYPDKFVARPFKTLGCVRALPVHLEADTLEALRALLPLDLMRLERIADDDPVIIETWS